MCNENYKAIVSSVLGSSNGAILWASPVLEAHLQDESICTLDLCPPPGIWVWEGLTGLELESHTVLSGTLRPPNPSEWEQISRRQNPCLSPEKPVETALDVMFTVAATLLGFENDDFIREFTSSSISAKDLLEARDALMTVCVTDEPSQVCVAWVPSTS